MKAVILTEAGGVENLQLRDLEQPIPQDNEVLLKVLAISINPVDIKTRKGGALYGSMKESGPVILGWDVAGTVAAIGRQVAGFKEGDVVFGMVSFPGHGRAYAEYVAAPAAHLAHVPKGIAIDHAAATTLAALTAWQVLVQQANLQSGQQVLIHAAAGGVGHFAVQIAKHLGATVTGTASAANKAYLLQLGVDHFIDYTTDNAFGNVKNMDVVLDPIGGDTTLQSLSLLKKGETLVSIVGGAKEAVLEKATALSVTAKNYLVHSSGEDMQSLARLLQQGTLKPTISHQFRFDQIADAHRQIESGRTRGKVIVNIE